MSATLRMSDISMLADAMEHLQLQLIHRLLGLFRYTGIPAVCAFFGRQWQRFSAAFPDTMAFADAVLYVCVWLTAMELLAAFVWVGFSLALAIYQGLSVLLTVIRLCRIHPAERRHT